MSGIRGVGTDLCEIARIEQAWRRHGQRFVARILGPAEAEVFAQRSPARAAQYLATRFAAKEAFAKAIGLGVRPPMQWADCEILNDAAGCPHVHLHGELARWCAERGLRFHVSLSDERGHALAFVVAEAGAPDAASSREQP